MYRYDSCRSGFSQDRGPAQAHDPLWDLSVDGGVTSSPAYLAGKLYFGTGRGRLFCTRASDGQVMWSQQLGGRLRSTPSISGGVLVVGIHDGSLQGGSGCLAGLDVNTGEDLWLFHNYGVTMSPLIVDGAAYFGSSDGHFFAVDVMTGTQRWNAWTGGSNGAPSIATEDGILVIVSSTGLVHGLELPSGRELWMFQTGSNTEVTPAISHNRVICTTSRGQLLCLNLKTGRMLWSIPTGTNTSPAIHDDQVVVNRSSEGHIAAFSLDSGQAMWTSTIEGDSWTSPTITQEHVYAKSRRELVALRVQSGETVWTQDFVAPLATSPLIASSNLYIGTSFNLVGGMHAFGPQMSRVESNDSHAKGSSPELWPSLPN